jgi:hypothetical protein
LPNQAEEICLGKIMFKNLNNCWQSFFWEEGSYYGRRDVISGKDLWLLTSFPAEDGGSSDDISCQTAKETEAQLSLFIMGLYHLLDGVTNLKCKLLYFLTPIKLNPRERH